MGSGRPGPSWHCYPPGFARSRTVAIAIQRPAAGHERRGRRRSAGRMASPTEKSRHLDSLLSHSPAANIQAEGRNRWSVRNQARAHHAPYLGDSKVADGDGRSLGERNVTFQSGGMQHGKR